MSGRKPLPNGAAASRVTRRRSKPEKADLRKLKKVLAAVYDRLQKLDDPRRNARARRNFVFHMTDWLADFKSLAAVHEHPGSFDKATAAERVAGFLYHVIPHLRAAGRLLLDYDPADIFSELDHKSG